jgi:hypothetical protein
MATLQEAISQIQAEVKGISGIREAPETPPESINQFPFAICFARTGEYRIGPAQVMTGLHTIVLELHVARKDLTRDVPTAMKYAKSIPLTIMEALFEGTLTAISTLERIRYEFGPLNWGATETIGFRFYIEGVKTQDTIE